MTNQKLWIYPLLAALLVLGPVSVFLWVTYQPGEGSDNNSAWAGAPPHSHYAGMEVAIQDNMQLMFNVAPFSPMYQITDGRVEPMAMGDTPRNQMKHVSIDVRDARLALGERLPVNVSLRIANASTGETIFDADTHVMYAPGHGYHFGNNINLPHDATFNWTVTVSPATGLRQAGAVDYWREPVNWEGTFTLDSNGDVVGQPLSIQTIGNVSKSGIHITLGYHEAVPLFLVDEQGASTSQETPEDSLYFVVDVTDHAINLEEKLTNAVVVATFTQGDDRFDVAMEPAISPRYGYHYGANVALDEGNWEITVTVQELRFMRQAGATSGLPTRPVSATFNFAMPERQQSLPSAEKPISISEPWVRTTVPAGDEAASDEMGRVTSAYMGIANHGDTDDTLVSVQVNADIATTVELHETTLDDNDVMQMRPVDGVVIPADGKTVLSPGSYHIMLLDVQRDLKPGDTVELTLTFESGTEIAVTAEVRELE